MLEFSKEDMLKFVDIIRSDIKKGNKAALFYDDFIVSLLSSYSGVEIKDINIPKSIAELKRGDVKPGRVIIPPNRKPEVQGIPYWRATSEEGALAHGLGLVDGNRQTPCDLLIGDKFIHSILGGATGHGKSVTLNSLIITACIEYPPWELNLYMSDAKRVEFLAYANSDHIPHIRNIAATGDADYIISMLQYCYQDMLNRNAYFSKVGVKNIKSFRKKTGLTIPQVWIVMDEFQAMFKGAKRKAAKINNLIDGFARLGRNTGHHLILASQELGDDLDKGMLGNIGVRMCLGCQVDKVSNAVIGNNGAVSNYNKKGRLVLNTSPGLTGEAGKVNNVTIHSPFLPDTPIPKGGGANYNTIFDYMTLLKGVGESLLGDEPLFELASYDEDSLYNENEFLEHIKGKCSLRKILLGEPSFILENPDREPWFSIKLKEDLKENIMIYSPLKAGRDRLVYALVKNFEDMKARGGRASHKLLMCTKTGHEINLAKPEEEPKYLDWDNLCDGKFLYRSSTDVGSLQMKLVINRKLLVDCDSFAFSPGIEFDKLFDKIEQDIEDVDVTLPDFTNDLDKRRFVAIVDYLSKKEVQKLMSFAPRDRAQIIATAAASFNGYKGTFAKMGKDKQILSSMFVPTFMWFIDLNEMSGLNINQLGEFAQMMKIGPEYGVYFIVTVSTLSGKSEYIDGFKHYLCNSLDYRDQNILKATDDYPDTVSDVLSVYYNPKLEGERAYKFKHIQFTKEI